MAEQKFGLIDTLVSILGRWNRHKKDIQRGNIIAGSEPARLEENRIGNSIIGCLEDLDESDY